MDARWKAALIHPFHVNVVEAHRDLNLRTFSVEVADDRVVRSLYRRSVGYTYEAVKIFMPAGAKQPVYAPYREHVPPDTAAASLWLRNRRKDEWRDKQSHEQAGPHGGPITLEALLMARIKRKELPKPGGSSQ
jgi:hypothetical protein